MSNDLVASTNVQAMALATEAASLCKDIVVATALEIQGRKYVKVEGWQAIANVHLCTLASDNVKVVPGGVSAVGKVIRVSDGMVVGFAEGFVGEDEPTWFGGEQVDKWGKRKILPRRNDYAIRAMAQTRAMSRAARAAFAHVVVMMNAGLSTTPAEEVPEGGFAEAVDATQDGKTATPATRVADKPKEAAPPPPVTVDEALKAQGLEPGSLAYRKAKTAEYFRLSKTVTQLEAQYARAAKVMADLSTEDNEGLTELEVLYVELHNELAARED